MSAPIALTDDNFSEEVLHSNLPVLVDFWAAWCGPCRMVAPIVEELATEYDGKAKVAKLDVDAAQKNCHGVRHSQHPDIVDLQGRKGLRSGDWGDSKGADRRKAGRRVGQLAGFDPAPGGTAKRLFHSYEESFFVSTI